MIRYNTPLLMVLIFLLLTLGVGLYVSQRATTFRAYAVGNKRLHTTTLVLTVLATVFGGGSLMQTVSKVHIIGLYYIVVIFSIPLGLWINSLLVLRMEPFMAHLSIAETLGSVYGRYTRVIAALLGICYSIGMVAIQINVMSSAIGMCIHLIDPRIVTVLATLILIAYAMVGGIRSITITDIWQFATFTIIIPLLIKFVFIKADQSFLEVIWTIKKQEKFQFSSLFQWNKEQPLKLIWDSLVLACFLDPSVVQRIYMASSPIQAYKVFCRVTLFSFIIIGCIVSIGLLAFVGNPMLPATTIWPYILADMPPVYKGCVVLSLLGMAMSSADSNLHTTAIMVSHDIVESIRGIKTIPYVHQLRLAKLTTLVTGLLAMIITVYYSDLLQLSKFVFTSNMTFFKIIIIPPFSLAVFGFRGSARTVLIGMTIGILTALTLGKWLKLTIGGIGWGLLPMVANGLAMMAAHYLLPQPADKGWIGKNHQQKRIQQLIRAFKKYKKSIDLE
ncbi:sodium:solute symporter family protein [Candidatus Cardinium sp. TP]|uniref:sodium:solute symporter family protein n=1 Tax=Candidatus Cardinium sp. TP TaxID=2961955 RepID=UPI0021AE7BE7|nr:sodium:solute symporter family protein [Candidatus Cardinium sp. TP]MCT4697299.1 sodium:solute symporter family protein [Candidatus Cardinium sp. TP]MDN5247058.1 sodium:solute symporter family protein [Candidatus Cardinium sp.]